jgi:hypothetical protein
VRLKISCKIVQKNPRLLISLTISISQSNVLPLSKQRSPSLKARKFFFFPQNSLFVFSLTLKSYQLCFFLKFFFFSFSSLRLFFFPNRTVFLSQFFVFVPLSQFSFSSLTVFFSQIAQCFFQLVYAKNLGAKFELGVREDKKNPVFFPLPHSPVPL